MSYLENLPFYEGGSAAREGRDYFIRNKILTLQDIGKFRKDNSNLGVYVSAYSYEGINPKEGPLMADFYLDFDSVSLEDAKLDAVLVTELLKNKQAGFGIPAGMIKFYFSGKKGYHVVVPAKCFNIQPDENLNGYLKEMAAACNTVAHKETLDMGIYDRRRLMRLENSIHQETNLYKIPLTHDEFQELGIDELLELAKKPRMVKYQPAERISVAESRYKWAIEKWNKRYEKFLNKDKTYESKPLDFTPACIQELIDNGPVKGQRNNTIAALTSFWKKQGNTEQEIWDKLIEWNDGSEKESSIKATMDSIIHSDYEYGCSRLSELATCIGKECPLYKENY